jgi:DNA-binding transcriptional ArsR family regulator
MVKKDPFLLVSLEENESKNLAQVISNDKARKILDFLSKHDSATESDIAKQMGLPLSTAHYNLQALTKANLVQAEEFHYSEKGKEVLHYSLANKIIIIAPKKASTESFRDKLKSILPIGLIALAVGGVIQLVTMLKRGVFSAAANLAASANFPPYSAMAKQAQDVVVENAPRMMAAGAEAANNLAATAPTAQPIAYVTQPSIAAWFLLGAAFVIILLIIWYYFVTRKNMKE